MLSLKTISSTIAALTVVIGAFVGVQNWADNKYAQAEDQKQLEQRVTKGELSQLYRDLLSEKYYLQNQKRLYPRNIEIIKKLELVNLELSKIESQLKSIEIK